MRVWKIILFWLLTGLCFLFGTMIAGQARMEPESSLVSFLIALFIALMFFLVGGLFLIFSTLAISQRLEESS